MKMLLLYMILNDDGVVESRTHVVYGPNVCEMYKSKVRNRYRNRLVLDPICLKDE